MTTKPKISRFRIWRGPQAEDSANAPEAAPKAPDAESEQPQAESAPEQIAAIAKEGLTGRQLRLARRVAAKNGIFAASDYDAVRQLRAAGIDPFQRSSILDLVTPDPAVRGKKTPRAKLPDLGDTGEAASAPSVPATQAETAASRNAAEILRIQRDIARRRRRKLFFLFARLSLFVFLPTAIVGWYYTRVATPMYATNAEIVIQQAQPQNGAAGGFGALFQGTSMATQQDSIAVQSYLASREAMLRLDADHGFKAHFGDPDIDDIQRLPDGATNEEAFALYTDHVVISYDPTEGLIRMEVIAADPTKSYEFSQALIGYAEEQVDQLTQRLRADQMRGALESYEAAEQRRADALAAWLAIQQEVRQIDAASEAATKRGQIDRLENQRLDLDRTLRARLSVERPSAVQVQSLRDQIANIDAQIAALEEDLIGTGSDQASVVLNNAELRTAEENYNFQTMMVQQALTQMETARIEANRQVRYLSQSVRPVIPDQATYPRAFENTLLAFLIFSGIYLMLSITVSILREQVSS